MPVADPSFIFASDAGYIMSQNESFAACYWDTSEGREFSLRSNDVGLDVGEIAKQYGGGNRHAAGFRVSFKESGQFEIN